MNKFIFILLILINSLFSSSLKQSDLELLKELSIEPSVFDETSFKTIFNESLSSSKISHYDSLLRRASLNVQIVREEVLKENLPEAVFFIPLIESSFNNQTRGKRFPAGLWQIIPETAIALKLRNDEFIDERLDLIKSTDAASLYLKRYQRKFNKWYLSIMAYNCGEGRVLSGITRASIDRYLELNPDKKDDITIRNYKSMIDDYQKTKKNMSKLYDIFNDIGKNKNQYSFEYLIKNNKKNDYVPERTLQYLQKLVALSIISNRDLFKNIDRKSKYNLVKVKAPNGVQIKSLANAISMNYEELKNINRQIKKHVVPLDSKSYNFYIPNSKLDIYNQKMGNINIAKEKANKIK